MIQARAAQEAPETDLLNPDPTKISRLQPESEAARNAWLANLKQELVAPVTAIREISEMMLKDAADRGPADFSGDVERIQKAGERLVTLVHEVLDPCGAESVELSARLRHDLRTPLNHVIGYCDLWLEEASDCLLESFVSDLQKLKYLAGQLLLHSDDLLQFGRLQSRPETAGEEPAVPEMIRDAVRRPLLATAEKAVKQKTRGSILVVDDNEINRDLLVRRLSREGHQVAVASDGRQALERVKSQKFDLLLLDILMPEMNGFQVLEQLKADRELRDIPVIMISSFQEVDSVACCVELGADDYLYKPFNPILLNARINACLEKKHFRDREISYLKQIEQAQKRADELLHVILPGQVVQELISTQRVQPRRHENVAVMFCDIVGFTPFCDRNPPEQVVAHLQSMFESWEEIALRNAVQKIKTVGDALMAAAGLLQPVANPVLSCLHCGLEMIAAARALPTRWQVRVGIHVGPVVAGVIGSRQFLYDLWGDSVNTAARMESHGRPDAVVLSKTAWEQVSSCCRGQSLGLMDVKGKGQMEIMLFESFC